MAVLKCRPQALTLVAVVVSPLVMLFYAFNAERQDNFCHSITRYNEQFQAISYYCNFIDAPLTGREGDVQLDGYNLEQIQVAIRHGDRAGIHILPNYVRPQLSCQFSNYPHLFPVTPGLDKLLETMKHNEDLKGSLPTSLQSFSLYPFLDLCTPGQLTPTGMAQHVKNGAFLQDRYKKWGLFNSQSSSSHKTVKLVSTSYERTFQSGLAFLYGLQSELNLSKIEVQASLNSNMCSEESKRSRIPCVCEAVQSYDGYTSQTYGLTFADVVKEEAPYNQIAVAFNVEKDKIPSTQSLIDIGMIHMCHILPLPGSPGKCMEISSLKHVVDEANGHGRAHSKHGIFPSIAKSRMLPLIDQIYTSMAAFSKGEAAQKVVLYSGHDTTLDPLLVALNISTGEWPMYASRLVIELYSNKEATAENKSYFFRILYNGEDRTSDAINCQKSIRHGLCPLKVLDDFLEMSSKSCDNPQETVMEKV